MNFLIRLLGGVTKEDHEKILQGFFDAMHKNALLMNQLTDFHNRKEVDRVNAMRKQVYEQPVKRKRGRPRKKV